MSETTETGINNTTTPTPTVEAMNMDQQTQKTSMVTYIRLYALTSLFGVVLVALTLACICKYEGGFGWSSLAAGAQFNWHPFLMILGLVFLYSQSILVYRTGRYVTSKKNLKYIHATIHLVSFIISVIGLEAVFQSHSQLGSVHLKSLHSWIGLGTIIIFTAQFLTGFVVFLLPGSSEHQRKLISPYHVFFGTITFIMAIICTITGINFLLGYRQGILAASRLLAVFHHDLDTSISPAIYCYNFMGIFAILYGILTLYLLIKPEYKRKPLPED